METKWLPPLMVCTMVMCIYVVFMIEILVPQLEALSLDGTDSDDTSEHVYEATAGEVVGLITGFHVLFFLFIISFLRAILTNAGEVPQDEPRWKNGHMKISREDEARIKRIVQSLDENPLAPHNMKFIRNLTVVERKAKKGAMRYCRTCQQFKPDRTHHCSVCQTCILRMDHHCPWIMNCVGFYNYKYFLLLLFYAICCVGFILGAMMPNIIMIFEPILDVSYFFEVDLPILLIWLLCAFLFVALIIFFGFHIFLTFNCMTTIEFREKKNNTEEHVRHRFLVAHVKFDGGKWRNFLHVFGPWYLWLIPVAPDQNDKGVYDRDVHNRDNDGLKSSDDLMDSDC